MAQSATPIEGVSDTRRSDVVVSISVRTLLVVAGIVAVAGALASIGSALLMIFVSVLCVAVLSPVAGLGCRIVCIASDPVRVRMVIARRMPSAIWARSPV